MARPRRRPIQRRRLRSNNKRPWVIALVVLVLIVVFIRARAGKPDVTDQPTAISQVSSSDFTVFISPGNGGTELGPVYPQGSQTPEIASKDITLAIGQAATRALAKEGVNAVLSRDGDTLIDALERRDRAEQVGAKLAIALYVNENYTDPAQAGIELIDYKRVDWAEHHKQRVAFSRELERALLERLHDFGVASTGVFTRNSAFTPDMPTVVVLVGFISNEIERSRLTTEEYQWQIANALTDAVVIYRDQLIDRTDPPADLPSEEVVSRLHVPF